MKKRKTKHKRSIHSNRSYHTWTTNILYIAILYNNVHNYAHASLKIVHKSDKCILVTALVSNHLAMRIDASLYLQDDIIPINLWSYS